jgi:hypothetical protein
MPWWGWLEWTVVAQTAMPALMFIPALTPIRIVTRVAAFAIALLAWAAVLLSGRRSTGRTFPAAPWLALCAGWLVASILHPNTNSITSGVAGAALNLAILSPALWGGAALKSSRQLGRLMALMMLCNAASALVGIGQFYRPDIFNPPVIPTLQINEFFGEQLSFTTDDGRKILRPCGLTDTPGAASGAGALTCLLGLCWSLRPIARWKRLAALVLSMAGAAALYLSQVRSTLIVTVGCIPVLVGLLAMRRDYRRAGLLCVMGTLALAAGAAWVLRSGGVGALDRVKTIFESSPTELYYSNRGFYLEHTFNHLLWEGPLGAGLGRWGMVNGYFGDQTPSPGRGPVFCEVQLTAWVVDGGVPLMVGYIVAIAAAMLGAIRVARTARDDEVGFWSVAVCTLGVNVVMMTFGSMPFIGPAGVQFWALFAAAHAANERSRLEAPARRGRA